MRGVKHFAERLAANLEAEIERGRPIPEEERRWLMRYRQRSRALSTDAKKSVQKRFVAIMKKRHPEWDWQVAEREEK